MSDILLNFSSQWPSMQVVEVLRGPEDWEVRDTGAGWTTYVHRHGLGYPPFALTQSMGGVDVDDEYLFLRLFEGGGPVDWSEYLVVVYAVDISQNFEYENKESNIGDVAKSSGKKIDLRDFLLHSRAVSPMLLKVVTKEFSAGDTTLKVSTGLPYESFIFGFLYFNDSASEQRKNKWTFVILAPSQAWPAVVYDGYTASLSTIPDIADRGTFVVLRNPSIISNNTVSVTV